MIISMMLASLTVYRFFAKSSRQPTFIVPLTLLMMLSLGACSGEQADENSPVKPALTVSAVRAVSRVVPTTLSANGSVAAWDEISISSEISGLQLASVQVEVGQQVHKAQLLASFTQESVQADLQQAKANLEVARASHEEAKLNAERARQSKEKLAMSGQQIARYLAEEKMASAKLQAAEASVQSQQVRLHNTQVYAMDDGVISARLAAIGGVYNVGQPLFQLIRQQRLEWRAEVNAAEIQTIKPGMRVTIYVPEVGSLAGIVRMIAPALNPSSRQALVYVDLPQAMSAGFRSGMYARGEFASGERQVWLVPQAAVLFRDGFHYLFSLEYQADGVTRVHIHKIEIGEVIGDEIVVRSGIEGSEEWVAAGVAFITDGDIVKVVSE